MKAPTANRHTKTLPKGAGLAPAPLERLQWRCCVRRVAARWYGANLIAPSVSNPTVQGQDVRGATAIGELKQICERITWPLANLVRH
jgi:hypothetical protein